MVSALPKSILFAAVLLSPSCGKTKQDDHEPSPDPEKVVGRDQGGSRPIALATEAERPECNGSAKGQLVYIQDINQLEVCLGEAWARVEPAGASGPQGSKGDKGERGPAGLVLGFDVKDASGRVIGATDFSEYSQFLYHANISFRLQDGVVMQVNESSGMNVGHFCYFASVDCSGACLHPFKSGEKNTVVEGLASLYRVGGAEVSALLGYQSYTTQDSPSPSCTALGASVMAQMIVVSESYAPPAGISYPFNAPLLVEPQ